VKFIVIVGTAGSGKSTLTGELADHMESFGVSVARLNFDPAAETLPYEPEVDVRDYVSVTEFMDKGLGPNGALIAAVDSIINNVFDLREKLTSINPDYVIVDTPGQMELFAYRHGGPLVLDALTHGYEAMTVFLIDSVFFEKPSSIIASLALASSVALRLRKPQVNIVSKSDLLIADIIEEIIPRLSDPLFLAQMVEEDRDSPGDLKVLMRLIAEALSTAGFIGEVIPVSVNDPRSLDALYAKIQQVLSRGEDYN